MEVVCLLCPNAGRVWATVPSELTPPLVILIYKVLLNYIVTCQCKFLVFNLTLPLLSLLMVLLPLLV